MVEGSTLAAYAALLADPTRATMCLALLDGRAWTSGELARSAGVSASTASEHLSQLVRAGLLAEHRQGRHRYLRLAGPDVAQVLEDLASVAGADPPPSSLRTVRVRRELRRARTCYDHLAGRLGVAVHDAMVDRGLVAVRDGTVLTAAGKQWLTDIGARLDDGSRRPVVRSCVDWTERRPHLAGQLGTAILREWQQQRWVVLQAGSRAVTVSDAGAAGIHEVLGVDVAAVLAADDV